METIPEEFNELELTGSPFVSVVESVTASADGWLANLARSFKNDPPLPDSRHRTQTPKVFSEYAFRNCAWSASGCVCTDCQRAALPYRQTAPRPLRAKPVVKKVMPRLPPMREFRGKYKGPRAKP